MLGLTRLLLLLSLLHVAHTVYKALKSNARLGHKLERLKEALKYGPRSIVLVDGDNVRGKTKFTVTKEGLCRDLEAWTRINDCEGRVCLVYDHGNDHEGFLHETLGVVFSGPNRKADDVIARDVVWLQQSMNCSVVVVTSDSGLKERCIRGARRSDRELTFIDSVMFVEMLGQDLESSRINSGNVSVNSTTGAVVDSSPILAADDVIGIEDMLTTTIQQHGEDKTVDVLPSSIEVQQIDRFKDSRANVILKELSIRNQIRSLERLMNAGCGKKKLSKLKQRTAEMEKRLKQTIEDTCVSIDSATLIPGAHFNGLADADNEALASALLSAPSSASVNAARAEQTWERVILAERLRNALRYKKVSSLASSASVLPVVAAPTVPPVDEDAEVQRKEHVLCDLGESSNAESFAVMCKYIEQVNRNFSRTNYTEEVLRFIDRNSNKHTIPATAATTSSIPAAIVVPTNAPTALPSASPSTIPSTPPIAIPKSTSTPIWTVAASATSSSSLSPLHQSIFEQQQRAVVTEPSQTLSRKLAVLRSKAGTKAGNSNNVRYTISPEGGRVYRLPVLGGNYDYDGDNTTVDGVGNVGDIISSTSISSCNSEERPAEEEQGQENKQSSAGIATTSGGGDDHLLGKQQPLPWSDAAKYPDQGAPSRRRSSRRARYPATTTTNDDTNGSSTGSSKTTVTAGGPPAMKIVAISDTHGLEKILTGAVPDGDILVHAGDYAKDGGKTREKYQSLDLWLSKLPHKYKIVIRGNHDPPGAKFPLSKAIYASKPTTVEIDGGIKIALAPHGTLRVPAGGGHILISHEPPFGILDEPIRRDKHAGSEALLRSVTRMDQKPQLWIFGHIHEGFGAINHPFRMGGKVCADTLCVNAGLANPGRAFSLVNLPVTIEVAEVVVSGKSVFPPVVSVSVVPIVEDTVIIATAGTEDI